MVYVLIVYSNPGRTDKMDEHLKTFFSLLVLPIPGGLTPVAQMLDRSPNRVFKIVLHDKYNEWWLIQEEDEHGKIAAPSRAQPGGEVGNGGMGACDSTNDSSGICVDSRALPGYV